MRNFNPGIIITLCESLFSQGTKSDFYGMVLSICMPLYEFAHHYDIFLSVCQHSALDRCYG